MQHDAKRAVLPATFGGELTVTFLNPVAGLNTLGGSNSQVKTLLQIVRPLVLLQSYLFCDHATPSAPGKVVVLVAHDDNEMTVQICS